MSVQKFRPITTELPKALLPLANAPLIEYPLEWLAASGVRRVHVVCCAHAAAISDYLAASSKWGGGGGADLEVHTIVARDCRSAGEALRLLDQRGIVQDDFVLLSCDCVTNMALAPALAAHRQRRCASSLVTLTTIWSACNAAFLGMTVWRSRRIGSGAAHHHLSIGQ